MLAFLTPTPLPLSSKSVIPKAQNPPVRAQPLPSKRTKQSIKMWTMEDLPPELRIPERPRIGFSEYSEKLNGRLAMVGFVIAVIIELVTGEGIVPKLLDLIGK